jgi:hypothetical protein
MKRGNIRPHITAVLEQASTVHLQRTSTPVFGLVC